MSRKVEVYIRDLQNDPESVPEEEIIRASRRADEKGVGRAIKDGLERDKGISDLEFDEPREPQKGRQAEQLAEDPDATTDEEPELPGLRRPKYGEGWWGRGPTLRPHKKGLVKEFIDGAGYPSPGRWRSSRGGCPTRTVTGDSGQSS